MIRSRQIAADLGLNMKIGDVEYQGDGNKAIFYYIADERVDFRQLIKVLAEAFRVRIDTKKFETAEAVCAFIKKAHENYLKIEHGVKEDCEYIVRVCHQVVQAILNLVSIAAGKEVERRLCPA